MIALLAFVLPPPSPIDYVYQIMLLLSHLVGPISVFGAHALSGWAGE